MMSAFLITITVSLSGWSLWFADPSAVVSREMHERMPSMTFCRRMGLVRITGWPGREVRVG
jgi:hypothetical protein